MQLLITVTDKTIDIIFDGGESIENKKEYAGQIADLLMYIRSDKFLEESRQLIRENLKATKNDDVIELVNSHIKTKATQHAQEETDTPMVRPLDVFAPPRRKK